MSPMLTSLLPKRRHEGARRACQRTVVMDVEDRCGHGTSLARQRDLLPAARIGTVFNVTHEGEAGVSARAELENYGSICVRICSSDGFAANNEYGEEGNEATKLLPAHGVLVCLSARPGPGRVTAVEIN